MYMYREREIYTHVHNTHTYAPARGVADAGGVGWSCKGAGRGAMLYHKL